MLDVSHAHTLKNLCTREGRGSTVKDSKTKGRIRSSRNDQIEFKIFPVTITRGIEFQSGFDLLNGVLGRRQPRTRREIMTRKVVTSTKFVRCRAKA
jgi:hypothetical protein